MPVAGFLIASGRIVRFWFVGSSEAVPERSWRNQAHGNRISKSILRVAPKHIISCSLNDGQYRSPCAPFWVIRSATGTVISHTQLAAVIRGSLLLKSLA